MSGIVGIINLDGKPVSRELLRRMTDSMTFRGPDAQAIWIDGNVGFGHTMLRTTFESEREQQPFSLDGRVWITADARVDDRKHLISKIESRLDINLDQPTDVELILRAYLVWGEDCLDHMIGDFSFVIWDRRQRRLFCARDHFGVKPFYYARHRKILLIGNTLDTIRVHPDIVDTLNEQAIGDFLLTGSNENAETTFFSDIYRLPAAHKLSLMDGELKINRYWSLPIQDEIRYRDMNQYVDNFVELLDYAVTDRLRTNKVGLLMSGGMDSATIAATAHKILSKNKDEFDLRAFTVIFNHLIPDNEHFYSGLVAKKLNMPIQYVMADNYDLYDRWEEGEIRFPEPVHAPQLSIRHDLHCLIAYHDRIALTGEGGDAILRGSSSYIYHLIRHGDVLLLIREVAQHLIKLRRLPRIGLRSRYRRLMGLRGYTPMYPDWLNGNFEARMALDKRWNTVNEPARSTHPLKPEAYQILTSQFWTDLFEGFDPAMTSLTFEIRHPFFDTRLINFALRLPSLPWCSDKYIIRASMLNMLPEEVRNRRKEPLAADPIGVLLPKKSFDWADNLLTGIEIDHYINRDIWQQSIHQIMLNCKQALTGADLQRMWINLRPVSLNLWLNSLKARV